MIEGLSNLDLKNLTIEQLAELQKNAVAEMKAKQKEEVFTSPEYIQAKEWAKPLEEELETLEEGIEARKKEIREFRDMKYREINEYKDKSKSIRESIKNYFSERNLPLEKKERKRRTYNHTGHKYGIEFPDENNVKLTIKQDEQILAEETLPIDPLKKTVLPHLVEAFLKRNNIETQESKARGITYRIKQKYARHFKAVNA